MLTFLVFHFTQEGRIPRRWNIILRQDRFPHLDCQRISRIEFEIRGKALPGSRHISKGQPMKNLDSSTVVQLPRSTLFESNRMNQPFIPFPISFPSLDSRINWS